MVPRLSGHSVRRPMILAMAILVLSQVIRWGTPD
jgi:hypothetical protein